MADQRGVLVADAWVTPGPPPGSQQHLPWSPAQLVRDWGYLSAVSILNCDRQGATVPEVNLQSRSKVTQMSWGFPESSDPRQGRPGAGPRSPAVVHRGAEVLVVQGLDRAEFGLRQRRKARGLGVLPGL